MDQPAATRPPLVIVNARASRLHDPEKRARLREALAPALVRRFGLTPDWVDDTHAAALAALQDLAGRPMVVAAGGDGTVREAAAAVAGTDVPLAIVPGGTGNVLAGTLRIGGMQGAVHAIRDGHTRRLDLGRARWGTADGDEHERIFMVACGSGFDSRVMAAAEHEWKRRLRFGAYIGAAVREAIRLTPAHFRITADEATIELDGLVVLIGNAGEIVPGRVGPRRPIDPTDGLLDLMVIGGRDLVAGVRGAADLLLRTGDLDGSVIRRSVRSVRVGIGPAPARPDRRRCARSGLAGSVRRAGRGPDRGPGALIVPAP